MRERPRPPRPNVTPEMLRARRAIVALAVLGAATVVSLCAWGAHYPLGELQYVSGSRGTHGSYTATSCVQMRTGKNAYQDCVGDFVPRAGGPVAHGVRQDHDMMDLAVGWPASYVRTPTGGYFPVGDGFVNNDVAGALMLVLLGVAAVTGLSAVRIGLLTTLSKTVQLRRALLTAAAATVVGLAAAAAYVLLSATR